MVLLDIRNLTIDIETQTGRVRMVDGINLTLNQGEMSGLIGESGSGKSLIVKVICGMENKNWIIKADRFRFDNIELLKLSPYQRRKQIKDDISIILQNPRESLDPSKTIGKQLIQSIRFTGRWWQFFGWKKKKAIELLHRVGIQKHKYFMNRYPVDLSNGEAQKVMIAMAVANKPRLLVADEPTSMMDFSTELQIYRLLSSMNKNLGSTVLLASNDILGTYKWLDSFHILYCGQNIESGLKEQVLKHPYHPYTAALLKSVPDFSLPLPLKDKLHSLEGSVPTLNNIYKGCRLGKRCPFSQKKCMVKPLLQKMKQSEFACHYALNHPKNTSLKEKYSLPIFIK